MHPCVRRSTKTDEFIVQRMIELNAWLAQVFAVAEAMVSSTHVVASVCFDANKFCFVGTMVCS